MAKGKEVWIVLVVIGLVLAAILSAFVLFGPRGVLWRAFYPDEHLVIEGDDNFTSANGVDYGSGTQADPYVIEGLDLTFSHYRNPCLRVANTTAYFVVKNSEMTYRQSPDIGDVMFTGIGIKITHSSNFLITNVSFQSSGIRIDNCSDADIVSNRMNYHDINAYDCVRIRVAANNRSGVGLFDCVDCTVADNIVASDTGILLSGSAECSVENNFFGRGTGISCENGARDCVLRGNSMVEGSGGILLDGAYNCTILENTIDKGGVMCKYGSNITIEGNEISNCWDHGITVWENVTNCRIIENNVTNCYCGISLYGASGCVVYHNNIVNNTNAQALDINGDENVWDAGYPDGGNYYSNYTGSDAFRGANQKIPGSDGIGDTPYLLHTYLPGGPAVDRYPLMQQFTGA